MNSVSLLAAEASSQGSPLGILILILPIAAIIFLTIVPQRKQKQKQAQLLSSLSPGDEVVTIGGIFGVINHIDDEIVHLEIDNDVVVRVGKGAIARNASEPDPAPPASRTRNATAVEADPEDETEEIVDHDADGIDAAGADVIDVSESTGAKGRRAKG